MKDYRISNKPVLIFNKDLDLIKICGSTYEAGKFLNVSSGSISSACKRKHKCKGYILKYKL